MFEKNRMDIKYIRDDFTYCEKLYDKYIEMRKIINEIELIKYAKNDPFVESEDFKQGFISAIKIMSSLFMDL